MTGAGDRPAGDDGDRGDDGDGGDGGHGGNGLTVAVTGPTGTFGFGLMPLLEADDRIARVVGVARRPFDPAEHGWHKLDYRRGDVREPATLAAAFAGADVVVHLAFLVMGAPTAATTRAVNVDGTLNVLRAAAAAGARRFVFASSVAAYGFHPDNPVGMTEEWPVRPADHFFYAREKAELETLIEAERPALTGLDIYILRPSIVVGPHVMGAKGTVPAPLEPLVGAVARGIAGSPVRLPAPVPDLPVQFVHEEDVGRAFVQCIVGAGPPGAYNLAGDGRVRAGDVLRELAFAPLPVPSSLVRAPARGLASLARLPGVPPVAGWAEAFSHPAIVDTTKARTQLGWVPRFSSLDALRATVGPSS